MATTTVPQGEDLSSSGSLAVVMNASAQAVLPGTYTAAKPAGVVSTPSVDPNVGTLVELTTTGPATAKAAAAITEGQRLTYDDDGRVRPAGPGAYVIGYADETVAFADDLVAIVITNEGLSGLPVSSAGVPVFDSSNQLDGNYPRVVAGRADSTTTRWLGTQFITELSGVDTIEKTYQFLDHAYLIEAHFFWTGAETGDWVDYYLDAPVSDFTSSPGTGSYDKGVGPASGSKAIYRPGGDGDYNLSLTDAAKSHPVPNLTGTGQFDWDTVNDVLVVNTDGKGSWDLYDADNTIRRICKEMPLGRVEGDAVIELDRPELILPGWVHTVNVRKDKAGATLNVSWHLMIGTKDGT